MLGPYRASVIALFVALALVLPVSVGAERVRMVVARIRGSRRRESSARPADKLEGREAEIAGLRPMCLGGCDKLECPGCGIPLAHWPKRDSKPMCVACGFRQNPHRSASSQRRYEWEIYSLPGWGWRAGWADGGKVKYLWQLPAEPADTPDGLRAEARRRRFDSYNRRSELGEQSARLEAEDMRTAEIERWADLLAEGEQKVDELERWLADLSLDASMEHGGLGQRKHTVEEPPAAA